MCSALVLLFWAGSRTPSVIKRNGDLPELAPLGEIAEAADGANVHVNETVGVVEAVVDRKDQHAAPEKPDRI